MDTAKLINPYDNLPINDDAKVCQCTVAHDESPLKEGSMSQCHGNRIPESNRFCRSCQLLHSQFDIKPVRYNSA